MKVTALSSAAILILAMSAGAVSATTFPTERPIYVASGVTDSGDGADAGTATSVHCTNLGPANATVDIRFYRNNSTFAGHSKTVLLPMGTVTVSTHGVASFPNSTIATNANTILEGSLRVTSDQSGVFCSAMIMDASSTIASGIALHMVRFNGHPGTAE